MFLVPTLVIATWLHIGIVQDPEFNDEHHFIWKKHPTFKVYFRSPIGESDMQIDDLSPEKQQEERDYQHYVLGDEG